MSKKNYSHNNEIKLLDLAQKVKGTKNVSFQNVERVLTAIPFVIKKIMLENHELFIGNFVKLGPRLAKDRITISRLTGDKMHMPEHLRFKATFGQRFKDFLNIVTK